MSSLSKEMRERASLSSTRASLIVPEQDRIEKEIGGVLATILNHLNQHLGKNDYFGDMWRISVDDLMFYNEIATI